MKNILLIGKLNELVKEINKYLSKDFHMQLSSENLEMIRADEEISDIPVIFLTGVNDREHIEMVLALRPAGYLLKPPVKERLLDEIKKAVEC